MQLSIVIPVYNKEIFITQCVESICKISGIECEILLVDDGSKDNSLQVCNTLAQKDSRIKVISQENQGVSVARNTGIRAASGAFLAFVDADDFVSEDFGEQVGRALSCNADLCIAGYSRVRDGRIISENRVSLLPGTYSDIHDLNPQVAGLEICILSVWGAIYKKSIISEQHLAFRKGMKSCEDFLFNLEYLPHVHTYAVIDGAAYCYRENADSATAKRPLSHADDYEFVFHKARQYLEQQCATQEEMELFRCRWTRWTAALVYNWKEQKFAPQDIWEKLRNKSFYEFSIQKKPRSFKSSIEYRLLAGKADNFILLYLQSIRSLKKILRRNDL